MNYGTRPSKKASRAGSSVKGSSKTQAARQAPLEDDLHAAVADLLGRVVKLPAMWTCFPAGNIQLPRAAAVKLARYGLQRGWPDFQIVHGKIYGIELKRPSGRLSKGHYIETARGRVLYKAGQEDTLALLEAAGMEIAICRSLDDVLACLKAWNIPTLGVKVAA